MTTCMFALYLPLTIFSFSVKLHRLYISYCTGYLITFKHFLDLLPSQHFTNKKLMKISPEQATKEYKYGTSGPRRGRGEPGKGLVKRLRERLFNSSTPNIRKLIFWSTELELIHFCRSGHDDKHVMQMAG